MTKEELMALLRDPDQTGQAVDDLNRLVEENPYFHTGHQLYLQSLKQSDETKMALQLQKTALSVRDRGVLYNYINRSSSFRQQPESNDPPEVSAPFIPGNSYVTPEADIHNIQKYQSEPSSQQNPMLFDGEWQDSERIVVEEIMSDEQLMDSIRRRLDQLDSEQADQEKQSSPETATNTVVTTDQAANLPTNMATDKVINVIDSEAPVQINPEIEVREEYSEDQLVADLIRMSPRRNELVEIPPKNQEIAVIEETPADLVVAVPKELTSSDLIDSFITSNPKIIPGNSSFQVDLSASLQEDPEIATEFLADIYATQGHKDKAIEIYEHLSLKYPEKHIYFAAQIQRLKE